MYGCALQPKEKQGGPEVVPALRAGTKIGESRRGSWILLAYGIRHMYWCVRIWQWCWGGTGPYDVSQRSTLSYILSASKSRVQAPVVGGFVSVLTVTRRLSTSRPQGSASLPLSLVSFLGIAP